MLFISEQLYPIAEVHDDKMNVRNIYINLLDCILRVDTQRIEEVFPMKRYVNAPRSFAGLLLTIMLFILMSGCGNSSGSSASDEAGQASEPAASGSPSATAVSAGQDNAKTKPRVAFVYLGVAGDGGWTYQHDLGVKYLEKTLGIKVDIVENVPDNADSERIFEELAQDHDIIFGTSYGYMDPMYNVAQKYPNVIFMHCSGYKTLPNMGTYLGEEWQTSYMTGIAAGKMSKSGHLGYVGAFPIPEVIYSINAFALGAQSVNPDATVDVVWSNTWFDPTTERQAAESLLDKGVDVLGAYQDSPASLQAAAERGAFGVGNDSDMSKYAPNNYITNNTWNWGPYYAKVVQSVMDGTWKSESYMGDLADGLVNLAPFGSKVPQDVKDLIEQTKSKLLDGSQEVFTGPIYDNAGKLQVKDGEKMTLDQILAQNWLVKGINGTVS